MGLPTCVVLFNYSGRGLLVFNSSFLQVRFLAWLEAKLSEGYDITEYEAASRLTEYRRHNKYFMGLAYENISASGPNAALPHYSPKKSTARMIDRDNPYLK
jgi:Xaa-Pro aminopeptidase